MTRVPGQRPQSAVITEEWNDRGFRVPLGDVVSDNRRLGRQA